MIGIDLVQISDFKSRLEKGDLDKIFLPVELSQNKNAESLSGIFAAKEAFFKVMGQKKEWSSVWIEKNSLGQPVINSTLLSSLQKADVSISHAGDYAIAIVRVEQK